MIEKINQTKALINSIQDNLSLKDKLELLTKAEKEIDLIISKVSSSKDIIETGILIKLYWEKINSLERLLFKKNNHKEGA
jgi:hypothetical protein